MKTRPQSSNAEATNTDNASVSAQDDKPDTDNAAKPDQQKEYGGRSGPEPTRYGDWEKNGIISDF